MVKKEEYTGKSDPDYYFKYAMRNGIQCVSRIYSAWRRLNDHGSGRFHRIE